MNKEFSKMFACLGHVLSLRRLVVCNLNYIYIACDPDSSIQRKLTGPLVRVLTLTVMLSNSLWLCVIPLPERSRTSTHIKCSSSTIHLFCIIDMTHMWAGIVRQLGNCKQVPLLYWFITYSHTCACYCNVLLSSINIL